MLRMSTVSRNIILNLSILVVTGIFCFVIAEIILRVLGYYGETSFKAENTIIVDDPMLNWRYKPDTKSYFNNIVYRINSRGFRDYVYPYQKKKDTFRIFLASDSVGLGTNVQMEDSYPKILEAKLNDINMPYKFDVVNYSMPGLSFKQKFHLVESYAEKYNPDLIIIDYVINDIQFESMKDPERERNEKCYIELINLRIPCSLKGLLKRSALIFSMKQAVENTLHKINWEDRNEYYKEVEGDYWHQLYSMDKKKEYLKTIFSQVGRYQKENDICIIVPISPLIYDYNKYKWRDINELIIALCNENDLLYISLLDTFGKFHYNKMRVQRGDFAHPSVKGNEIAAEAILKMLARKNLIVKNQLHK